MCRHPGASGRRSALREYFTVVGASKAAAETPEVVEGVCHVFEGPAEPDGWQHVAWGWLRHFNQASPRAYDLVMVLRGMHSFGPDPDQPWVWSTWRATAAAEREAAANGATSPAPPRQRTVLTG